MKNFDALLGTMGREAFLAKVYGEEAMLLAHSPTWFDATFSLCDLNHVLNFVPLSYPRVRATDHCNSVHKYDLIEDRDRYANNRNDDIDPEKLVRAVARGATLVVDRIQHLHPPLESFVDTMAGELGIRTSCNAYYSTRRTLGVNAHFDRHDVFAVQIQGSKRWYFRHAPKDLSKPIRAQETPVITVSRDGWSSIVLAKGDVLYCPRGLWHFTETEDDASAHVAIGLYPLTVGEWLNRLQREGRMPEILEQFVTSPRGAPAQAPPSDLLEQVFDELRGLANDAQPRGLAPLRPYVELE